MRPRAPSDTVLETRTSSIVSDGSRRVPRGSSRMRWSPCGSEICVLAAHGLPLRTWRLPRNAQPDAWNVPRHRAAEHVRTIVRQPPFGVGQAVWVPPERAGAERAAELGIRGSTSARWLQSGGLRPRVGRDRMPPVRIPLFQGRHQALIGQEVAVLVGQQEAPARGAAGEYEDRHNPAVCHRSCLLAIAPAGISPADEVAAILPDVGDRHREPATQLPVHAHRILVGEGRAGLRIQTEVSLRIDNGNQTCISARGWVEGHSRDGCLARMNRAKFARQYALMEPPVARPQHRSTVRGELGRHAQARRPDVPRVERAEAPYGSVNRLPGEIALGEVGADGAAVVESDPCIDRQTIADGYRVTGKCAGRDEPPPGVVGSRNTA
jgi:hypothetical protein